MTSLRVLLADESTEHLRALAQVLEHLGHEAAAHAVRIDQVADIVAREDPDVAVVALHEDREHALGLISEICDYASGPVVCVIDAEDPAFVQRAAEHGVYAYAQPLNPTALQSAIDVALQRRAEAEELERRVGQLETALERRALIERAKGVLMERHGIDDRAAFERLRAHARSNNHAVIDVARAVLDGHGLLPKG